jgi:hypothetical protein
MLDVSRATGDELVALVLGQREQLADAARTLSERTAATVARALAAIRASPVVYADETGWREDGVNGCA